MEVVDAVVVVVFVVVMRVIAEVAALILRYCSPCIVSGVA